jgi:hypothetical protein
MIHPGDMDLFLVTDDIEEAVRLILDYMRQVGPPTVTPRALA